MFISTYVFAACVHINHFVIMDVLSFKAPNKYDL
jgi:hypothetical protein